MLNPKIADHHLARQACIYIRQSTAAQVRFNQESTERQYNLADQARALGWIPEQIRILDGPPYSAFWYSSAISEITTLPHFIEICTLNLSNPL